ncbi:MAG: hypothetical protein Faunusvirus66_3 [Faunusvirus sp.]|uniref:Uncharacterized protein n=1 Tax=Faunusvirus sp. TaxID=2487766 RepID=A0A3G4ZY61_9VIRU|nr:MAG: hypothetical protein Faunusvirus66_3 [Faunusvirus sp.]
MFCNSLLAIDNKSLYYHKICNFIARTPRCKQLTIKYYIRHVVI